MTIIEYCLACQKLIDIYGIGELLTCNDCGHLYRKSIYHCDCDHYECYKCKRNGLTKEEILKNDEKISAIGEELYTKIIDKLNLVNVHSTEDINSIDGIPAICNRCLKEVLIETFIEDNNTDIIYFGSTKVKLIGDKMVIVDSDEDIYSRGKNITEKFLKYKIL
ncbi:MAG: hypothetical protein GF317_09820 [Candidatus Lokiarchaeota archaeon]|nr:hypothetical protein [Candidatus Lokiarchaeota archaeon]